MKVLLIGGVLDGQEYEVPDGTTGIKFAKDAEKLEVGSYRYLKNDKGDFVAAGTDSSAAKELIVTTAQ